MPFTQNPLQWKNLILSIKGNVQETVMQYFQQQLGDWCNQASLLFQQLQSAPFLAGILNNTGALGPAAITNLGGYYVDSGAVNAYAITASPAVTSYKVGQIYFITPAHTNTGASTLAVNGLATKAIVNASNLALLGNEIAINQGFGVIYDGTSFRIVTYCPLSTTLGVVGVGQTINCAGYNSVTVNLGISAALTLTLNNLSASVPVYIRCSNGTAGALVFKLALTNASGAAINSIAVSVSNGAELDMKATGFSIPASTLQHLWGSINNAISAGFFHSL